LPAYRAVLLLRLALGSLVGPADSELVAFRYADRSWWGGLPVR